MTDSRPAAPGAPGGPPRFPDVPPTPPATGPAALEGVRVLDLSSLYAGPWIATNLGDHGAEVLKVEHPRGDDARRWGLSRGGVPLWWKVISRNKELVRLDLHDAGDRDVVRRLAARADIVIENFRPGRLESWGLGYDRLSADNPGLIMVRVTGYGQTGPRSQEPGFGTLAEAFAGFAHMTGAADGPPTLPPFGLADGVASAVGAAAALMALYWRDARGGTGQVIDLSLYEPLFSLLGPQVVEYTQTGRVQKRTGNRSPRTAPRNAYRTADDRYVTLSAGTQQIANRIFAAIDRPDLADDPRFASPLARRENSDAIDAIVAEWIAQHDQAHVLERFSANQAPIAPVYDTAQIVADPHFLARASIVSVPDPDLGEVVMQNTLPHFSRTPGTIRHTGRTEIDADRAALDRWLAAPPRHDPTPHDPAAPSGPPAPGGPR
ncbi:CoA transferase [Streptomyces sulfonofaciens]|uniref:CoA transferase n=1 Tax=Streptomyces sulfonofaciens TaxID=68272 RepID=A0A919L0C1_9ACTN|nr:CoA transferase [Streptomyces sulfonofaciens]GHH79377.1 CoA transferase [Streptomyces sulfonofaciens]